MKKVDIIIPVHNRPEHTKQTLESLMQNTPAELFNLYIVDDVSDKETVEVLNYFVDKYGPAGKYFFEVITNAENIGPGASRNKVCDLITKRKERSEYLYHSDNDVYFTEDWLSKLILAFEKSQEFNIKLLGGGCHPYLQNNHRFLYKGGSLNDYIGIKDAVSGYSQLMTWETWDKYGPFDETMRNAEIKIMGSEDWAFCQKIIKDGYKVGSVEPEVVVATGKTNTYGLPATGSETFKNIAGVSIK